MSARRMVTLTLIDTQENMYIYTRIYTHKRPTLRDDETEVSIVKYIKLSEHSSLTTETFASLKQQKTFTLGV